ncbi:GrpB family protein [Flaviaesturariibacter amylovorans]|uniref:GrpB family protein n=1 Tax=Flaviaesturariibacter amylovorans TaxID=1084520 RepID=A0ABP8HQ00_9BACT
MKVSVVSYDPGWTCRFEAERAVITAALHPLAPAIGHIGSTSVPGLAAKPIVDILVGVGAEGNLDETVGPMTTAGFTYVSAFERAWPARRFFVRLQEGAFPEIGAGSSLVIGRDVHSLTHIHLIVHGTPDWIRDLAFRDRLRSDAALRTAYTALKLELSAQEWPDMNAYNTGKDAFVKAAEAEALRRLERKR